VDGLGHHLDVRVATLHHIHIASNRPSTSPESALRHSHASLLSNEGAHPKKISVRLGHSSIKLTMDT
jgi:integrase